MPHLVPISGKEMAKIAEKLGFIRIHQVGSHCVYQHPDGRRTTIPIHSNEDLIIGLIHDILKQMKLSRTDYDKFRQKV